MSQNSGLLSQWAKTSNLSIWLSLFTLCIAFAAMQPGIHMLFWVPLLTALIFCVRFIARLEGKAS